MKTIVRRDDGQRWTPAEALKLGQALGMGGRLLEGNSELVFDGTVDKNQQPLIEQFLGHPNFDATIVEDNDPRLSAVAL